MTFAELRPVRHTAVDLSIRASHRTKVQHVASEARAIAELNRDHDLFVCRDCGADVYSFPAQDPPPELCSTCRWLDQYVSDPVEREQLRKRLMERDMSERRVWIAQCLCPKRHCIAAAIGEADDEAEAQQLITEVRQGVDRLMSPDGGGNPWCGICGAARETWHEEVGRTRWRSMADAGGPIRDNQIRQLLTSAILGSHGPQKPGRA
jgi:hypothetical protein